jgi:hypothetical protein
VIALKKDMVQKFLSMNFSPYLSGGERYGTPIQLATDLGTRGLDILELLLEKAKEDSISGRHGRSGSGDGQSSSSQESSMRDAAQLRYLDDLQQLGEYEAQHILAKSRARTATTDSDYSTFSTLRRYMEEAAKARDDDELDEGYLDGMPSSLIAADQIKRLEVSEPPTYEYARLRKVSPAQLLLRQSGECFEPKNL